MSSLQRPLVAAALAYLAGLLSALRLAPHPRPLLCAAAGALVTALLARRSAEPSLRFILVGVLLAGAAAGAAAGEAARRDCLARLPDGAPVSVHGSLGASVFPGPGPTPLVPLEDATLRLGRRQCRGTVRVHLPAVGHRELAGSELALRGTWRVARPSDARSVWPAAPGYAGFVAGDSLADGVGGAAAHPLLRLRGRTEANLRRILPERFALADALLLGRREWLEAGVRDRFAAAGLSHLLAISGMHVGLLAGVLLLLLRILRVPPGPRTGATLAAMTAYLGLIGVPASAVRAGIMLSLALAARLLQRPAAALPAVAGAAVAITAFDPLALLEPGFQLSFLGVLGLVAARGLPRPELPRGVLRALGRPLVEGLVSGGAAFAFTAPVAAYHFGVVAPVAILANLPAVPLLSLALVGIAAGAVLQPVLPAVAAAFGAGGGLALVGVDRVAGLAAAVPGGHFAADRPAVPVLLLAAAVGPAALRWAPAGRRAVRCCVAAGCSLAVVLMAPGVARLPPSGLQVHFIDVGQGDAIAIHTPGDHWLLVDAGPASREFDAGARRVLPFLRAHGARRLEALVLTHPDADHVGGAAAVLEGIPVARVVEPGLPVGRDLYRALLARTAVRGTPWSAARAGQVLRMDGVEVALLWPDPETFDGITEANQISVVARVSAGSFAVLLTGDAPEAVERTLVERYGAGLRSQVLKAGHHGSRTSTSDALLDAVQPRLVVISAGRRNRYGHPAPQILERLRRRGIEVARTDREGTVTIRVGTGAAGRWRREQR